MLLRLQDESGELIKPGIFLPAAERYNLLTRVDRWGSGKHVGVVERGSE